MFNAALTKDRVVIPMADASLHTHGHSQVMLTLTPIDDAVKNHERLKPMTH
jgi:hypothetical protein